MNGCAKFEEVSSRCWEIKMGGTYRRTRQHISRTNTARLLLEVSYLLCIIFNIIIMCYNSSYFPAIEGHISFSCFGETTSYYYWVTSGWSNGCHFVLMGIPQFCHRQLIRQFNSPAPFSYFTYYYISFFLSLYSKLVCIFGGQQRKHLGLDCVFKKNTSWHCLKQII